MSFKINKNTQKHKLLAPSISLVYIKPMTYLPALTKLDNP